MSRINTKSEKTWKKSEVKELTLADLKHVRGGEEDGGHEEFEDGGSKSKLYVLEPVVVPPP